jgi:hypothetical protein
MTKEKDLKQLRVVDKNYPLKADTVPLILTMPIVKVEEPYECASFTKEYTVYATTIAQKRNLLEFYNAQSKTDKEMMEFISVWPGKWKSDVFHLSPTMIEKLLSD